MARRTIPVETPWACGERRSQFVLGPKFVGIQGRRWVEPGAPHGGYNPYAPCMVYFHLQNWLIFRANVGKYCIHGAYG